MTQDVGADPTVSRDAHPGDCDIKEGSCGDWYCCGCNVEQEAVEIKFCMLCGDEIFCTFCGQEPAVVEGAWMDGEAEVVDVAMMDEGEDLWERDGDDYDTIEEQSWRDVGRLPIVTSN